MAQFRKPEHPEPGFLMRPPPRDWLPQATLRGSSRTRLPRRHRQVDRCLPRLRQVRAALPAQGDAAVADLRQQYGHRQQADAWPRPAAEDDGEATSTSTQIDGLAGILDLLIGMPEDDCELVER